MKLQQLPSKLQRITLWGAQGKYHLLSIVCIIITILYLIKLLRFVPDIVALMMTLTGLLIILRQQVKDAMKFGSQKPNTFMGWLKSFPIGEQAPVSGDIALSATVSMKIHGKASISADATIEDKVDFLLRRDKAIDSAIEKVDSRVDEINSLLKDVSRELHTSIDTLSTALNNTVASHAVGSYDVSLLGIILTICGTIIQFFCS